MATNDETTAEFNEDDLVSLGEKLAALELTDGEQAALAALIGDDDVAGFGRFGRLNIAGGIRIGYRAKGGSVSGIRDPDLRKPGVPAESIDSGGIGEVFVPGRI